MIGLGYRDEFLMVSVLVCMVTYWIRPMVNYDIDYQIVMIHQTAILHRLSTLKGY